MRNAFVEEMMHLAEADSDVILITGDLGFGVFEEFEKSFPTQFLNVGVAEQNMAMVAAGLALEGKKVFFYSIGNFPVLRCFEQIRNDICYHDVNVTVVCMGGGFSYGQLGMSHFATEDLSTVRALPNMTLVAPCCDDEVRGAVHSLYQLSHPAYLRLDKSKVATNERIVDFTLGTARTIRNGTAATLITCGGIVDEVIQAAITLSAEGIDCRVLSMHTVKPLDQEAVHQASSETGGIITVEENTIIGGLGSAVAECCLESAIRPGFFKRIGLNDVYSSVVGDQKYLRNHYGMSTEHIVKAVKANVSL